uniref:Uncharacterized protein n=1 Tax=Arundo donax TaxID=35708 RepID=A0A0A9BD68_ARUDO
MPSWWEARIWMTAGSCDWKTARAVLLLFFERAIVWSGLAIC